MRKTKEEAAATRQAVLDAALIVFSEKGYAATNLEDIAKAANVTRGAIYWHFKNKADLYTTLVQEVSTRMESVIEQVIAKGSSIAQTLREMLINALDYLESDEQFRLVMELTLFKTEALTELQDGMQQKASAMDTMLSRLADLIREGIAAGDFRANLKPLETATTFLALQNGLSSTWLLSNRTFSLKASAETAADIFIRGLQP